MVGLSRGSVVEFSGGVVIGLSGGVELCGDELATLVVFEVVASNVKFFAALGSSFNNDEEGGLPVTLRGGTSDVVVL